MWGDKKYRDFEDALSSKGTQRNSLHVFQIDFMDSIIGSLLLANRGHSLL